jgi:hypothetical protein
MLVGDDPPAAVLAHTDGALQMVVRVSLELGPSVETEQGDQFMTHLSMTEGDAEWSEHVTDAEYHGDSTP